MLPRYSVFGSCVTRDAADLGSRPLPRPVEYFSRSKIQSIVSTPTAVPDDIGLDSAFQTRVVIEDHRKSALPVLAGLDHALVVDLIDERFGLVDSGAGLLTDSLYLRNSSLHETRSYEKAPEDRELAQGGPFARAVERLAAALPPVQVVVHRALWATVSVTGEPLPKPAAAERMNGWLSKAYDLLASTLPNVTVVTPDPGVTVADPGHRWGLAPFHYVPAYYDDVSDQVRRALADA